jgi:hypothetical protein
VTPREDKLLGGNRVLTQKIAHLKESAQRSWESLEHYVSTRTEEQPCGFCGSWGEHDNDACDLVAVVTSLAEDFGCGEHWRGETIPADESEPNEAHEALDALAEEAAATREGRTPTAVMLDRAVKALRVKNAALETVRAELDLPEHLAEIVGDALAKDAGRV